MGPLRLLFASFHCYIDPSSGAAWATRDLLELLATRGVACRALSAGVLDYDREVPLAAVLAPLGVPTRPRPGPAGRAIIELELGNVPITLLPTASSGPTGPPTPEEEVGYLDLADHLMDRLRPHILLTFGGQGANRELMARARRRGIAVCFHLHNFSYHDRRDFVEVDAVLVPSEFARQDYARRLGLAATAIPYPIIPDRVLATGAAPRFLTFVNPQPAKGAAVVARIAAELSRRRPEIPLLIVEGRGTLAGLAAAGVDPDVLGNVHRMANTPDPREFYRVSRAVLMPSLWRESFGRVAAEALTNGIPVLASDRGALPETLGDAGFLFAVPPDCTPEGGVPTAHDVVPWLATIERLWDDPAWERAHRERAYVEARRWEPDRLAEAYESFFRGLVRQA